MMPDDDDDDDDDNDDPMILNIRAKNHTSERTIVPWTVIFKLLARLIGRGLEEGCKVRGLEVFFCLQGGFDFFC